MPKQGDQPEHPFAGTQATQMLKDGLTRAADDRGLSTRAAARELGYKATVVISHMATGRAPIPLDRAVEIAQVVGLDVPTFYAAVLEQRYPGSLAILRLDGRQRSLDDDFLEELQVIAGGRLSDLSADHKDLIREVVSARSPKRRWLSLLELPVILLLRRLRPDLPQSGMRPADAEALEQALRSRSAPASSRGNSQP
jgi:hypothetical protein